MLEAKRREMSKQAMREETERLVKEALERRIVTVKQGQTRIETKCGKCGAPNRCGTEQEFSQPTSNGGREQQLILARKLAH